MVQNLTCWDVGCKVGLLKQSQSSRWTGISPLFNMSPSMSDFVPCDRVVQRAYCLLHKMPNTTYYATKFTFTTNLSYQLISTKTFGCYLNVRPEWFIVMINNCPNSEYLTWTRLHIAHHCGWWLSSIRTENLRSYHQHSFVI